MFNCTKCGACCELIKCPEYDREKRLCKIYETRPDICRIDKVAKYKGIDPDEYYKIAESYCRDLEAMVHEKRADIITRKYHASI